MSELMNRSAAEQLDDMLLALAALEGELLAASADPNLFHKLIERRDATDMAEPKIDDLIFKRGSTTLLTWGRVSGKGLQILGRNTLPVGFEIFIHANNPPISSVSGQSQPAGRSLQNSRRR